MGKFNFGEKFEYWAVVWGMAVMTPTVLPGKIVPVAFAAYGGEALLAVLAIIIWHTYNVHVNISTPKRLSSS